MTRLTFKFATGWVDSKTSLNSHRCTRVIPLLLFVLMTLGGCSSPVSTVEPAKAPLIRFLLTFDDGPSGARKNNPTEKILNALRTNPTQPNIKAIFFVQTRSKGGGATIIGQSLLKRMVEDGHLLGFHTATQRHTSHEQLTKAALDLSITAGINDITSITGKAPMLVRPPFWQFSEHTLRQYHKHGLSMLLTDLSANDGKIYGVNWSMRKRSNFLKQLQHVKQELLQNPNVWTVKTDKSGVIPVVVTFHDTNAYTAKVLPVYLNLLIDVAHELKLPLAEKPFYDNHDELQSAALLRVTRTYDAEIFLPSVWKWLN